jgi:cytoskeletal protein CcmA (bactofilin family)
MAGYTRQSVADIINGLDITAPPLNAEFNQVAAAFDGSTGHAHDGSAGNAPKITLSTSVDGYLPADHGGVGGRNKTDATSNPTVTNDAGEGYAPGSLWLNTSTGRVFICAGNATGAAVWREAAQITENGVFFPETNDTVDLGTTAKRFKNLYLSGAADIEGSATVGGNLSVSGNTDLSNVTVSGVASLPTVNIDGGNIDGAVVGNAAPAAITGTIVTANTGFTGDLTGNVTGNLTGNVTGDVSGNLTGDVTGDVASSGTSTFQNVTINGSLDINAGTAATVTGLSAPVNATDAATKGYVDQEVSAVIDAAPGALDTLNELSAALNDDADFATTVNNTGYGGKQGCKCRHAHGGV